MAICVASLANSARAASALEQIRAGSGLPRLDLRQLQSGAIVTSRGPLGAFPFGVYAESAYFIHAPVAVVGEKLMHWNGSSHGELGIRKLHEYRWPAKPSVWDSLNLNSSRPDDRWIIDRTRRLLRPITNSDLHLTQSDVTTFRQLSHQTRSTAQRGASVNFFWRKILQGRNDALARGGLSALPVYSANGARIDAGAQFNGLLKLAPRIAAHFRPLVNGQPFNMGGRPVGEIVPYWEMASVRGHTALLSAFLVARKGNDAWQISDCTYYVSDTYFMSFSLYELRSQADGTLVWQIDFASAPFHSFTAGLDRVFAGKEMEKEAVQIARLFRADVERNR